MSSNFCSKKIDWSKFAVVYAGAQKNVGPAGVCMLMVREDLFDQARPDTPLICDWTTFSKAMTQFQNTPVCWSIYMCGLNLAYMREIGLDQIAQMAKEKSDLLYIFIDNSKGFYSNSIEPKFRSRMNIPFRVNCDEALENKFISEAT